MDLLDKLDIQYEKLDHSPITTMEEGTELMEKLVGTIPINLLFKDNNNKYYLVVKNQENKMKLNDIGKQFSLKGFKMVRQQEMVNLLQIEPGSLSILALNNLASDILKQNMCVLIDKTIPSDLPINFHPKVNNITVTMGYDSMISVLNHLQISVLYF